MNINGNTKLKTTAEGLLEMALRLAFVIDSMALNWLYLFMKSYILDCKAIGKKGFGEIWEINRQMSYIYVTNVVIMKKTDTAKKTLQYKQKINSPKVYEPTPLYKSVRAMHLLKEFTYSEFKKIADKAPFTQAEWAAMLHVSERTLQRYAKNNGSFAYINAERAMQIANVAAEGKKTFGKIEMFYNWLKQKPVMLEGEISLASLTTSYGIQMVLTELGRLQHGILA